MISTFFGPHSFGGDAAFVDRLARALARRSHDVHVIYCRDAFEFVRGRQTPRPHETPPGVTVHELSSSFGALSPLLTHQTGRPVLKRKALSSILDEIRPDVLHFHNISLIGGPGLLEIPARGAIKLMTAHEHWLVCPMHVLWKYDGTICDTPDCVKCCLKGGRPPQLWRRRDAIGEGLRSLDALICPSRSTIREHARRGVDVPMTHLPYFLPGDYTGLPEVPSPRHDRPYFAAVGRLEEIKGFQDVIDAARRIPEADFRIAGTGGYEQALRDRARGLANVFFEGRLDAPHVSALLRGARAVVVPSLVHETFGYVVLEAFAERTPAVVRNLGALPELIAESEGGIVFRDQEELVESLRVLSKNEFLRDELGEAGYRARHEIWSEDRHLDQYFSIIRAGSRSRPSREPRRGFESPRPGRLASSAGSPAG